MQSGAGSGVIISQDGYILTCAHVVSGATSVKVQLNGSDESYDATIVGQDSTSDIAVLKIVATGLTPAVIGDSDALAVGEVAVAVGNPLGTLSNTVTDGIVSALNRQVTVQNNDMTLIQTDASISPGNSGGGLFNANGELIGIVNAKSSYSEAEGIGFAIPINTAMEISRQLIESGSVARPALGVKIVDVTDAQTAQQLGVSTMGVYVVEVTKGSGADLTLGSGTYIDNFEDQIVGHTPGETFDVTVTFPEDYGNEDLNGKEAVFETTLNYIKESVTPELTDDWVKENLGESMSLNSVDELKAFVKSTMLYDNQASDVYTDLHDKASYADELPQTALDYYRDVLLYRIYTNAQKYGTDMNTLLSSGMMGSSYDSVDAYLADANDSIKSITQQALLMQAVAEKTGFKCDTATMNADFGRYYGTTDPSQYVSAYGENYIKMNVLQSDVMQNLIDNVKYE